MGKFTADFETTTDPNDCRVWAYGICNIDDLENVQIGNNIDDFMAWCSRGKVNHKVWFHNLKFDGMFILDWLFDNGFRHVRTKEEQEGKTFSTLISDKGLFYSIEVIFAKSGRKVNRVVFYDSLKLLPMKIEEIAEAFHLPVKKGSIDYNKFRPVGYVPDENEKDYITGDVKIAAYALKYLFSEDMVKMTTASNALQSYKNTVGMRAFDRWFPKPSYDSEVRQSYKGGFTYADPRHTGQEIGEGIVLDVNSLYPSVMYYEKLPYGEPVYYEGEYVPDKLYPLYVQQLSCQFELKEGYLPTIQIKKSSWFSATEYLTSSRDKKDGKLKEVTLTLTSVDLALFLEHYDVYNPEYIGGYKFKGAVGFFQKYIDHWSEAKIQAKKEGNHGLYILSKLMLNGLYGKFAVNPIVRSQIPYKDEETGVIKFDLAPQEERDPIYIPMGTFITAYARNKTIRAAQAVYDRFLYADTDSLHLIGRELPEELDIDSTKLGAWDHESTFCRAKFLRAKCYIEEEIEKGSFLMKTKTGWIYGSTKLKITCAGMPQACYKEVTFDNFQIGSRYTGKLKPERVPGGVVLKDIDFTIRRV